MEETKRNLSEYEYLTQVIRENLNKGREILSRRENVIAKHGFNSKDRVCKAVLRDLTLP